MAIEPTTLAEQWLPWMTGWLGEHAVTAISLVEIMGINILLSGDNAVVIALACRSLPPKTRYVGIVIGVMAAIVLRVGFTLGLQSVINWPWLTFVGGLLLLWIAVQLLIEADDDDKLIADSKTLAGAVWTIALADLVMSLDNVLAIAGAAHGKPWLIAFGLALSIPMIVGGATLIIALLTRMPAMVWAGAALLGWIAGGLILSERMLLPAYQRWADVIGLAPAHILHAGAAMGALFVLFVGAIRQVRRTSRQTVVKR